MIALLLFALWAPIAESCESVDCIELNIVHNEAGERTLDQFIFWGSYVTADGVRAWTMADSDRHLYRVGDRWHVTWFDTNDKVYRHISSEGYRTTYTQVDREREDLKKLPDNQRVRLIKSGPVPKVSPVEESE